MNLTTKEISACVALVIAFGMFYNVSLVASVCDVVVLLLWHFFSLKLSSSQPGGQVRYRREHSSGRQLPFFPLLEDLMRDVCDGAALLTVVHCYCPDLMKLEGMLCLHPHCTLPTFSSYISLVISCSFHNEDQAFIANTLNLISMCDTIFDACAWRTVSVESV